MGVNNVSIISKIGLPGIERIARTDRPVAGAINDRITINNERIAQAESQIAAYREIGSIIRETTANNDQMINNNEQAITLHEQMIANNTKCIGLYEQMIANNTKCIGLYEQLIENNNKFIAGNERSIGLYKQLINAHNELIAIDDKIISITQRLIELYEQPSAVHAADNNEPLQTSKIMDTQSDSFGIVPELKSDYNKTKPTEVESMAPNELNSSELKEQAQKELSVRIFMHDYLAPLKSYFAVKKVEDTFEQQCITNIKV